MSSGFMKVFDLYGAYRGGGGDDVSAWRQGVVWVGAALGVVLSPYATAWVHGVSPALGEVFNSPLQLIWGLVFGALLLIVAYKLALAKPSSPLPLQIGVAVLMGFCGGTLIPMELSGLGCPVSLVFGGKCG